MFEDIYWKLAKDIHPDLPESPVDLLKPGMVVDTEAGEGILLGFRDGTCIVMMDGETYDIEVSYITLTGESIPLQDLVDEYRTDKGRKAWAPAQCLTDEATGQSYGTVSEFCEDTGLSKSSAYKMLNAERDIIRGHALRYTRK